jgi:hypothetical protein
LAIGDDAHGHTPTDRGRASPCQSCDSAAWIPEGKPDQRRSLHGFTILVLFSYRITLADGTLSNNDHREVDVVVAPDKYSFICMEFDSHVL